MEKQNKPRIGKRAQAFKLFLWVLFEFFLVILVSIYIVIIVNSYVDIEFDIGELERELFIQNLINSPEGISYVDVVSGRVYPGIINIEEFSNTKVIEAKLDNAFNYGDRTPVIAVSMTLMDANLPHYFFTDKEKIRPHILEDGNWVEKEVVDKYTEEQLTAFIYGGEEVPAVYYQRAWYERWIIIAETKYKGKGGFTQYEQSEFVLVKDLEGNMEPAVIQFSIITPGRQ